MIFCRDGKYDHTMNLYRGHMSDSIDMKQQLEKLMDLQKMDSELFDVRAKLETYPIRLSEMDASLEDKKEGMIASEEAFKKLQILKNSRETDMDEKEDKIKKHEGELYKIKNNKEYQALKNEIDSIKADVSLIEEEIIGLFDRLEEAKAGCDEEKRKFSEESALVEKEKSVIRNEEEELRSRLRALEAERDEFTGSIDPPVLAQYQRILNKWGRVAVAVINGEFCGECNMHLRPQIINDAKIKRDLVLCEICTRILYAQE